MIQRLAIYPGSFDPVTKGHLDIVVRTSKLANHVIVAIGKAHDKRLLFSLEERVALLTSEIEGLKLPSVSVAAYDGLLVDYARTVGASILVRGLRTIADFEREKTMSALNHALDPTLETIFLPASEDTRLISSSAVKELVRYGKTLGFVSDAVAQALFKKLEVG